MAYPLNVFTVAARLAGSHLDRAAIGADVVRDLARVDRLDQLLDRVGLQDPAFLDLGALVVAPFVFVFHDLSANGTAGLPGVGRQRRPLQAHGFVEDQEGWQARVHALHRIVVAEIKIRRVPVIAVVEEALAVLVDHHEAVLERGVERHAHGEVLVEEAVMLGGPVHVQRSEPAAIAISSPSPVLLSVP